MHVLHEHPRASPPPARYAKLLGAITLRLTGRAQKFARKAAVLSAVQSSRLLASSLQFVLNPCGITTHR